MNLLLLLTLSAPLFALSPVDDCKNRWSDDYKKKGLSRDLWDAGCEKGYTPEEMLATAAKDLSKNSGGSNGAVLSRTNSGLPGARRRTAAAILSGEDAPVNAEVQQPQTQPPPAIGDVSVVVAAATPQAVNCALDLRGTAWTWNDVLITSATPRVPDWLRCLASKTDIPPDHVYVKMSDMPLTGTGSHRGIRIRGAREGWSVGFRPAAGPVCRSAASPGGIGGSYVPDGRCASVNWVSETPGGEPLCYSGPVNAEHNIMEISPGATPTWINPQNCVGLDPAKRYYCNFTMVGFGGQARPADGADCDTVVVSPITQVGND